MIQKHHFDEFDMQYVSLSRLLIMVDYEKPKILGRLWEGSYYNYIASVFTFSFWAHSSITSAKLKYSGT